MITCAQAGGSDPWWTTLWGGGLTDGRLCRLTQNTLLTDHSDHLGLARLTGAIYVHKNVSVLWNSVGEENNGVPSAYQLSWSQSYGE